MRPRFSAIGAILAAFGLTLALTLALTIGGAPAARAQAQAPMADPDSGLPMRVITRPGAELVGDAGGADGDRIRTFSVLYVFAQQEAGGQNWLQVSPGRAVAPTGWVRGEQTIPWKHRVVVLFKTRSSREPVMFFDEQSQLTTFMVDPNRAERLAEISQQAAAGGDLSGVGVVGIEPEVEVDPRERFYLLPVIEWKTVREAAEGFPGCRGRCPGGRVMKIASVPEGSEPPPPDEPFRMAVVFVIDTTRSMLPYLDEAKRLVLDVSSRIQDLPAAEGSTFAMIGFRDDTECAPGLLYQTKVLHPLELEFDRAAFEQSAADMTVATISSCGFAEDGLAGLELALKNLGWDSLGEEIDGKFIVYVTDAPAREPSGLDSGSEAAMSAQELSVFARDVLKADVVAIRLETAENEDYRRETLRQMRMVAAPPAPDVDSVFEIKGGEVSQYTAQLEELMSALTAGVQAGQAQGGGACDATNRLECYGFAMWMRYLGRTQGAQAPDVIEGWTTNLALDNPTVEALRPHVLLDRRELSDLYVALLAIERAAEETTQTNPEQFFEVLQSVAAQTLVDDALMSELNLTSSAPPALGSLPTLGALLPAFLDQPPFGSQVTSIDRNTWMQRGPQYRENVLKRVSRLRRTYEEFFRNTRLWTALAENAPADEEVVPLPLAFVP